MTLIICIVSFFCTRKCLVNVLTHFLFECLDLLHNKVVIRYFDVNFGRSTSLTHFLYNVHVTRLLACDSHVSSQVTLG